MKHSHVLGPRLVYTCSMDLHGRLTGCSLLYTTVFTEFSACFTEFSALLSSFSTCFTELWTRFTEIWTRFTTCTTYPSGTLNVPSFLIDPSSLRMSGNGPNTHRAESDEE